MASDPKLDRIDRHIRVLKSRLTRLDGVASIESSFALAQEKYTSALPLRQGQADRINWQGSDSGWQTRRGRHAQAPGALLSAHDFPAMIAALWVAVGLLNSRSGVAFGSGFQWKRSVGTRVAAFDPRISPKACRTGVAYRKHDGMTGRRADGNWTPSPERMEPQDCGSAPAQRNPGAACGRTAKAAAAGETAAMAMSSGRQ